MLITDSLTSDLNFEPTQIYSEVLLTNESILVFTMLIIPKPIGVETVVVKDTVFVTPRVVWLEFTSFPMQPVDFLVIT